MSILIKGIEKPETCGKCPFCQFGGLDLKLRCLVTDESIINFDAKEKRAGNCPLVEMPSRADVVEVVRCKDCKHHEELLNNNDGNVLCWVHGLDVIVDRNGYCNYGEREEQEHE